MPIPTRRQGESRSDFIGRCMSDYETKLEFPDRRQRYAVCINQSKK